MRGVSGTVIFGETGHRALLQLFDPFDFSLQAVADVDGKAGVFGIEDVSFGAAFEGVAMGFNEVFQSGDSGVELQHFSSMVGLSLFDGFEQRLGDTLQGVGVKVSAAIQDVGCRSR